MRLCALSSTKKVKNSCPPATPVYYGNQVRQDHSHAIPSASEGPA